VGREQVPCSQSDRQRDVIKSREYGWHFLDPFFCCQPSQPWCPETTERKFGTYRKILSYLCKISLTDFFQLAKMELLCATSKIEENAQENNSTSDLQP
jgi:hypothetical protein